MFNLQLTADQLQFRDTIRNFVKNEIKPLPLSSRYFLTSLDFEHLLL